MFGRIPQRFCQSPDTALNMPRKPKPRVQQTSPGRPVPVPAYPGMLLARNRPAPRALVQAVQAELVRRGYGPLRLTGRFDAPTASALRLYQAQHVDRAGRPLQPDGVVGPLTWGSLFGFGVPRRGTPPDGLAARALEMATDQLGVAEHPPGSNRGPAVDQYLAAVDIGPEVPDHQRPWCQAFVYWCFREAAADLGIDLPLPRTAGVLEHWRRAGRVPSATRYLRAELLADPSLVQAGMLLVLDYGNGRGHIGFVAVCAGGTLLTVEGNINPEGDPGREGVGVYATDRRTLADQRLKGMIRYD